MISPDHPIFVSAIISKPHENLTILVQYNLGPPTMTKKFGRLTFLRQIYRRLLERGRTYAAFDKKTLEPLITELSTKAPILDPMSGYGTLMTHCAEIGLPSICVELNPPAYYWQELINPINYEILNEIIKKIKAFRKFPSTNKRAVVSEDWFSPESWQLAVSLYQRIHSVCESSGLSEEEPNKYSLAIFLPFVGRFSTYVQGNIVIEIKKGGICVFEDWLEDFRFYLDFLDNRLAKNFLDSKSKDHLTILGDCRRLDFSAFDVSSFITSPAYPNYKDYKKIFAPENFFLNLLSSLDGSFSSPSQELIGGTRVKNREQADIRIKSEAAKEFLHILSKTSGSQKVLSDVKNYYLPYFNNYFGELQEAYENLIRGLRRPFEGFIIVVDNTSRGKRVPLGQFTIDTFVIHDVQAEILQRSERSHIGTLNPLMKGYRARHMEWVISIKSNG